MILIVLIIDTIKLRARLSCKKWENVVQQAVQMENYKLIRLDWDQLQYLLKM